MQVADINVSSQEGTFSSKYYQPNPHHFCIFCHVLGHSSHSCKKYRDSHSFWVKVLEERRCKNCLRLFHHSNNCFDKSLCKLNCKRRDKHSSILCYVRDKLNNCENYRDHGSNPTNSYYYDGFKHHDFGHSFSDNFFHPWQSAQKLYRNKFQKSYRTKKTNYRPTRAPSHSQSFQRCITSVSKVDVSTQTEELSPERLVDQVSQSTQTDFKRFGSVNDQSSVGIASIIGKIKSKDYTSKHRLKTEEMMKSNYDDSSSCYVKDYETLMKSLHKTQPKTAELFNLLRDSVLRLQQQKIPYLDHSLPPN